VSCRWQVRRTSGAVAALVLQVVRTFHGRWGTGRGDEASRLSAGSRLRSAGRRCSVPSSRPVHVTKCRPGRQPTPGSQRVPPFEGS
jgi:hypothetical protein